MENISIILGDITQSRVDAIVNAANTTLLEAWGWTGPSTGAGPGLLAECRTLGAAKPAMPKLTGAYNLPCRYVIHTPGPIWQGGDHGRRPCCAAAISAAWSWPWPTAAARWISPPSAPGYTAIPCPRRPMWP